jgi:hypothetical protein
MKVRRFAVAALIAGAALAHPAAALAKKGRDDPPGHNRGDDRGKRRHGGRPERQDDVVLNRERDPVVAELHQD